MLCWALLQKSSKIFVATLLEDHNIQENLDDIKLEIEKLIEEREEIIKENNFLQYYKERFVLNFQLIKGGKNR